jgi:hypothetical protein
VQRFKRFLEERRDELAAPQILYRLPYAQRRLTYEAVDDLKEALKRPPWLLEPVDIWRAYKRLASDKVRGNPAGTLADVVMLVRYAIGDCESLEPLPSVVAGRFNLWLGREEKAGRSYSGEQRAWLMAIRDHLGVPAGNGLSPLMASQLRLATEDNPPRLRPLAALPGSCPDQFPFKLGEAAQNGQHQTTMCRRGVSPSVSERFEARLFFPNRPQQVQKIAGGPGPKWPLLWWTGGATPGGISLVDPVQPKLRGAARSRARTGSGTPRCRSTASAGRRPAPIRSCVGPCSSGIAPPSVSHRVFRILTLSRRCSEQIY